MTGKSASGMIPTAGDAGLPERTLHHELTWWKKVQLDALYETHFHISPPQTINSVDHALFWEIVKAVRESGMSYKLMRVSRESMERKP